MLFRNFNTNQISQISLWNRIALAFTRKQSVCDFEYSAPIKTTFKVRNGITYIIGISKIKGYEVNMYR